MNHDAHLDNLLDEALSEYRDAEPLTGLESRILARIAQPKTRRSPFALRWAVAFACATAVALAIWLGVGRRTSHPVAPAAVAKTQTVQPPRAQAPVESTAVAPLVAERPHNAARSGDRAVLPVPAVAQIRPAVFPSPSPLTAEERAFLAALNQSPGTTHVASEPDKPITIAEIEIKPLAIGGVSLGEK